MPLDDMPAHRVARAKRTLQVHLRARNEFGESCPRLCLAKDIRSKARAIALNNRKAHAIHCDRLSHLKRLRPILVRGDFEDKPRPTRDALDSSDSLYESGEHSD